MREDPDVVLVGEMRDLETMALAMETANTGHLVLATLHASTAASTIDRRGRPLKPGALELPCTHAMMPNSTLGDAAVAFHPGTSRVRSPALTRIVAASGAAAAVLGFPGAARASFLSGETLDKAADILALVVIFMVPVIGIVVFWLVHILPEKIAHARNHPQTEAIQVLCLLSLFFGGMLWPIAWLWAYTKPVLYKMAYGTDKAEHHAPEPAKTGHSEAKPGPKIPPRAAPAEVGRLKEALDALEKRGVPADELRGVRAQIASLEASLATAGSKEAGA